MAGRRGCLRRGCGCLVLVLLLGAVVAGFSYWRSNAEPEVYQEQRQLLEQRSPAERGALAEQTLQKLRDALRRPAPSASRSSGSRSADSPAPVEAGSGSGTPRSLAPSSPGQEQASSQHDGEGSGASPSGSRQGQNPEQDDPEQNDAAKDEEEEKEGAHRVTLRLDELNALLEQEASRWMAEQGSDRLPLSNPTLAIEDDHLVLFVQLSTSGSTFLLGLPFQATVDETGGVVHLLGVRLGQLSLPGLEALPRLLRAAKDPRLDRLAEKADAAAAGYPIEPRLDLGDGRSLWVLDAEVDPQEQAVHLLVEEN